MTMSDRICLMNAGQIEQLGAPSDLYFRPRTVFVADFLGESNLLPGRVTARDGETLGVTLTGGAGSGPAIASGALPAVGTDVTVMVRPQNIIVRAPVAGSGRLVGRLTDVMVTGSLTKLYLEATTPGLPQLVAAYPTRSLSDGHEIGQLLELDWQPSDAVAITAAPGH